MRNNKNSEQSLFDEKVVLINRVSKKTKGGNRMSFTALMVVGDKKGKVGVALGKAPDVLSAIQKGVRRAKKKMIAVPMKNGTIPFKIETKFKAARVLLKPAPNGTGIIAGGPVRAVVEAAGLENIVGKIIGTSNQTTNVYATFKALEQIQKLVDTKQIDLQDSPDPQLQKKVIKLEEKHEKPKEESKKTSDKKVLKKKVVKKSSKAPKNK